MSRARNTPSDRSDRSDESDGAALAEQVAEMRRELGESVQHVNTLLILLADIREATGVGMRPMAIDLPEVIRQRIEDGELWTATRRDAMLAQHAWLNRLQSRRPALARALDPANHPPSATTASVLLTVIRIATTRRL